jgi:hypothetical protein
MYWTAAIIGYVTSATHSGANPNAAPDAAYVAMPEGSSSEDPVTKPGPSVRSTRRNQCVRASVASMAASSQRNAVSGNRGAMAQIAIQELLDGRAVDWLEHVSDEPYRAGATMEAQ